MAVVFVSLSLSLVIIILKASQGIVIVVAVVVVVVVTHKCFGLAWKCGAKEKWLEWGIKPLHRDKAGKYQQSTENWGPKKS